MQIGALGYVGIQTTDLDQWADLRSSLALLQGRIDQEAEEFCTEAHALKQTAERDSLRRQTTLFMQNHVELVEAEFQRIQGALAGRTLAGGRRPPCPG